MTTAVVLGGGFAGVLAATVLARHVDAVTVVESGWYPADPGIRPGLPQAHHNHVLVAGGASALETLLPGTLDALAARGAHRRDLSGDALILSAEGWFRRHETGAYLISCSRWLMDHVVRQRALASGAVSVRERTRALGLAGDASRVAGVVTGSADGRTETIKADIVVDATGRRSRAGRWLAELGGQGIRGVEEATVDSGLAYSTRVYQAPADLAAAIPAVMLHPRPAAGQPGRGATLFPVEGGRWIVTLTGTRGGEPPAGERGFVAFARSLRSPIVAELMAAATPLGGVRPYRATSNRRRFFERARLPEGFLVIGDALVAVNPVYSHGMSVAALSALRLDRELEGHGAEPSAFPRLQAAMAAEAERSWRMATEQDGGHTRLPRELTPSERQARLRMTRTVLTSRVLMARLFRAQTLIPPEAAGAASIPGEAPGNPEPPLSTDEAIAQYPGLSGWWLSGRQPTPVTSTALTGGIS
jgi:flavin-dependent dehydrogenase